MVFSLTWLPEVLEAAGLKVAETENWRSRGRAEMGTVRGVMCHHTATPNHQNKNMPTLDLLIRGRSDLPGPLAQLGLGRDGTWYVVAAGRANHAGKGQWEGVVTGNSSFIGVEAENDGKGPWPEVQMDAYRRGVAAILAKIGAGANMCCGHKEYALPAGRKPDPNFDMPSFRAAVSQLLDGKSPPPPIAAADAKGRPTIRRGSRGEDVAKLQAVLGISPIGIFGPQTEAALRAFQRKAGMVPDGICGPKTWEAVEKAPAATPVPAPAPAPPPASPAPAPAPVPAAVAAGGGLPPGDTPANPAHVVGQDAIGPHGKRFAGVFKKGFFTRGTMTLPAWLASLPAPPAASASELAVLKAVSPNEGLLDAINSYDGCFMSFGMFQWTAGLDSDPGELPVLLRDVKALDPAGYQECFGQYGLDAKVGGSAFTGKLVLGGKTLDTGADKQVLRSVTWAYRFWRAGQHGSVRLAEFNLAAARIKRFLTVPVLGKPLNQWLSSEFGVALLLDEHINRPGHVPGTLVAAIQGLPGGIPDPSQWTTADERQLTSAYIAARAKTNMTDSTKRANAIKASVTAGQLADTRGSYA